MLCIISNWRERSFWSVSLGHDTEQFCQTDASGEKLLKAAVQQLHLSAIAYHRVLKLARTIADLAGSEMIAANHVAEAVQYRPRVGM